jgi:hypothetical protein
MNDYGFLSVLESDTVFRRRPEPWGTHYPEGIFIAGGAGVVPRGRMPRLEIVDIAPILLRSLGLAPEPGMQGRCPDGLYDPAVVPVGPQPPADPTSGSEPYGDRSQTPDGLPRGNDRDVEALVIERLKALAYLES